jgi:ATP-dependent DNA ligase
MGRPVLNRQEFVIVGWTDPEGSRSPLGSLLLGYYTGKLIYAGLAGTGMTVSELTALLNKLRPLASGVLGQRPEHSFEQKAPDVSHVLPNRVFWEASLVEMSAKSLISMVGAQGLEPWTR